MSTIVEFRYVEVPAGGADALRVGLGPDARGVPAELVIAMGHDDEGRWYEYLDQGITIPAAAAPHLVQAILQVLSGPLVAPESSVTATRPSFPQSTCETR